MTGEEMVALILAGIAEDERAAMEATPAPWTAEPVYPGAPEMRPNERSVVADENGAHQFVVAGASGGVDVADAEHVARHDPARVLRECTAKRAIVAQYLRAVDEDDEDIDMESKWVTSGVREALERVVRALASVYVPDGGVT